MYTHHTHTYIYIYIYIYIMVPGFADINGGHSAAWIHTHTHTFSYMYVCIYVCVYIYTHILDQGMQTLTAVTVLHTKGFD